MCAIRRRLSKAPFGRRYRAWTVFKSMVHPGDHIVRYTAHDNAWQGRGGEAGYALLRSNCLVETFPTIVS